ncbi:MAG: glycine--tRNA ligase subunit beta [Gammaproteobacteria bacterium]|nr:glycine--tRNA ligase subunit beta [Gammaproteobacteria bacterium]
MQRKDFLVEIGCEELPPNALRGLAAEFAQRVLDGLKDADPVLCKEVRDYWYCSPRRMALVLQDVPVESPSKESEVLGPPVKAAFDQDGNPTKAAEGFAAKNGVSVDQLERRETDKGEKLACTVTVVGKQAADELPGIVEEALKKLNVPKRMRWGDGAIEFARPIHWIVMLFGKEVIDTRVMGVQTGRDSRGHRFHHPSPVSIPSPSEYAAALEAAHVRVNDASNSLAEWLGEQVNAVASDHDATPIGADDGSELLDEVAALNEWPVPVVGNIPERFMDLPEEVLVTTLEVHQRYFPLRGADGRLLAKFITFANIESKEPDKVRIGNERVVAPRLEDAMFFWNTDRKQKLAERLPKLDSVTFQKDLGSYGDKVKRVAAIAEGIADTIDGDTALAERAAMLAKCDLVTDMVFEFTELQGVIGCYYAEADGEEPEVSQAVFEQYLPRFAGDRLPASKTGQALAIADKLDTIVGMFAIGQPPTGSKDPFALRRQALGLLRIIIEHQLPLDLQELVADSYQALYPGRDGLQDRAEIMEFFMERLRGYCADKGIRADLFMAVQEADVRQPHDFMQRARAIAGFMQRDEAAALAAANKRINNIIRKTATSAEEWQPLSGDYDASLFVEPQEQALAEKYEHLKNQVIARIEAHEYSEALDELAALKGEIDAFFDAVMVNADDPGVARNRLELLAAFSGLFDRIADFSQIQVD